MHICLFSSLEFKTFVKNQMQWDKLLSWWSSVSAPGSATLFLLWKLIKQRQHTMYCSNIYMLIFLKIYITAILERHWHHLKKNVFSIQIQIKISQSQLISPHLDSLNHCLKVWLASESIRKTATWSNSLLKNKKQRQQKQFKQPE